MLKNIKLLNINDRKIGIEAKLFAVLCLCLVVISIINVTVNWIIGSSILLNLYIFTGIIVDVIFYHYALVDKISNRGRFWYFVYNTITISPFWFINAGSLGSTSLYFIFYLSIAILSLNKRSRIIFICIFFAITSTCLILEHIYPNLIKPYPNENARNYDLIFAFLNISFMMIFMLALYKKVTDYDRFLLLKSKQRLEVSQLELIVAKDTAEAATTAKSVFLTNMSHEIRTPLNGITGASELLNLTKLDAEQADLMNTLQASNSIMIDIVNDLLDISRIEANKMEIHNHPFDIRKCVADAENIVKPLFNAKNLQLIIEIADNIPEVLIADEIRYKQIIINLLSNAVKFTEFGYVKLMLKYSGKEDKKTLITTIKDTGIGIADEDMVKLFLPFSQVNSSATRKVKGAGLGLAICRKLAEMMNGGISAKSEIEGGSEFTLIVPIELYSLSISTINQNIISNNIVLPSSEINILIAEDNIFNQIITSKMLERSGYNYAIANDGLETIEKVKEKNFNIILMDMQMPHLDGLTATEEIIAYYKKIGNTPPIIIGCSANAMQENKNTCLKAGMNDFLAKPFTLDDLRKIVIKWTNVNASS